jgi:hypothetical protein
MTDEERRRASNLCRRAGAKRIQKIIDSYSTESSPPHLLKFVEKLGVSPNQIVEEFVREILQVADRAVVESQQRDADDYWLGL